MSLFDAVFSSASPALMHHMGTATSVSIMLGETTLVDQADAIIRHVKGEDEFNTAGEEIKMLTMEIDLMVDDSLSYGGLPDDYTNTVAIVDSVRWSVDRILNKTETFQRLRLIRKVPRAKRRNGFYRDS